MKVSVITISYNPGREVLRTIDSVLSQTYPNIEWIIIDGGSADGTVDLFEEHINAITHFISEPDKGISNAMNKGIALATGDALVFMNAGDMFFNSSSLESLVSEWDTSKYDWATGSANVADISGVDLYTRDVNSYTVHGLVCRGCRVCHASTIVKRSIFNHHGGYDERFKSSMDYELWVRLISRGVYPQLVSATVSRFYLGGTSGNLAHRYKEDVFARTLHGMQNTVMTEWFLASVSRAKQSLSYLKRFPLSYKVKELLKL